MNKLGLCHSLALTDKGQVLSWGTGDRGQLGQGFEQMNDAIQKPRYIKAFEKEQQCDFRHRLFF